jgi:acyl-homoserine-lactone acylase
MTRTRPIACLLFAAVTAAVAPASHSRAGGNPSATQADLGSRLRGNDQQRLASAARKVTILRDKWGIPHVYGKTDADAVFGMMYAQAEDDFNRIELNYINAMGRLAEVEGEKELWRDLRMKLYINPDRLKTLHRASAPWLKQLMQAWADGLNWYLHTHPNVKPKLINKFEPWMALSFSEGSIGGDIESINLKHLEAFYTRTRAPAVAAAASEPRGSNGFAIAPRLSASGHALLLINPHTSFYFRPEIHVVSEQGLNAYGAVTWGQFFVYQGFNERAGWMHTSGGGDVIDEYLESIVERNGKYFYKYGNAEREVKQRPIRLPYKTAQGMVERVVTAYFTHHGPIVRGEDGAGWISVRMMDEPLKALTQSYLRTKARNYASFRRTMELRTNSSNNTVYADADGTIAYFHGNFLPRRDPRFDWRLPVDGSNPATDWKGLHSIDETITLLNPATGWIQNTNNWPFSAAGAASPKQQDYPRYMWALPENARGRHAVQVLEQADNFTLDSLIGAAYDNKLTAFEPLLPQLLQDFDSLPSTDPLREQLAAQVEALRGWDLRYSLVSVPTSLAHFWAQEMVDQHKAAAAREMLHPVDYITTRISAFDRLSALVRASARITKDFGTWQTPWGEINRFQRASGDVVQQYDDDKPSWPVPFASANWGSLAAYGMVGEQKTRRIYGDRGNSFVAVVEFGPRLKAKSILAGGQSSDPASPHFADQAEMYSKGQFKEVLFYREDIEKHLERRYQPGL